MHKGKVVVVVVIVVVVVVEVVVVEAVVVVVVVVVVEVEAMISNRNIHLLGPISKTLIHKEGNALFIKRFMII